MFLFLFCFFVLLLFSFFFIYEVPIKSRDDDVQTQWPNRRLAFDGTAISWSRYSGTWLESSYKLLERPRNFGSRSKWSSPVPPTVFERSAPSGTADDISYYPITRRSKASFASVTYLQGELSPEVIPADHYIYGRSQKCPETKHSDNRTLSGG